MPKTTLTASRRPGAGQTNVDRISLPESGTTDWFDAGHPGLALRVSYGGRRTWCHMYRVDARLRRRTLGTYPAMSLDEARDAWGEDRKLLRDGGDPEADRRHRADAAAAERAAARTFREAVEDYHRRYQVGEAGNRSAGQVIRTLLDQCSDWHDRRVDSITAREIGARVEGIRDAGHPYGANLLFAYLRHLFRWCARPSVGFVPLSPMVGMTRPFARPEVRDRWYDPGEVAGLWHAADRLGHYEGAFLRMVLLTGKRKRALAVMRWDEIGADGWWRPADAREDGRKLNMPIPLPAPARRVLRNLRRLDDNPYVFAGRHRNKHLDPGSPLQRKVQTVSGVPDFYWHACRDTIATHMKDLRVPGNAARRYLDHAPTRDAHERSYTHDELIMATEDAAETWGRFVRLVARRRVSARVSAHLDAGDTSEGDRRREAQRARKREFCALIQTGGEPWVRWVRGIARPASRAANVVALHG